MAEREKAVPQSVVAALYGVDMRTIRNWVAAGMPQRVQSGRPMYLLSEVIPWRREQDKADAAARERPDLAAEQARKMKADADLAEMKAAQMRGALIDGDEVARREAKLCDYVRVRVLGIRGKWAPKILGLGTMPEATALMDRITDDILAALREQADEADDDVSEEAA